VNARFWQYGSNSVVRLATEKPVRNNLVSGVIATLSTCRIEITVPPAGVVNTESCAHACNRGSTCRVEVADTRFNETFTAEPANDYQYAFSFADNGCGTTIKDEREMWVPA
jgi:hypothetical protein